MMVTVKNDDNDIAVSESNLKFHSESFKDDTIFTNDSIVEGRKRTINDNIYKKRPHKTLHIFHNIKREKLYVTYENNIKSPIEYNSEIRGKEGIYIIERYIVPYVSGTNIRGLGDYYSSGVDLDDDVRESILNILMSGVDDDTKTDVIRYVGFISRNEMIEDGSIYVVDQNILLSINDTMKHFPKENLINVDDHMINFMIYDSRNPGKNYFINIFGIIRKTQALSVLKSDGIYITYKSNGIINEIRCSLEDISDVGIYKTKEEAMSHGDLNSFLEIAKFKHAIDSLKIESINRLLTLKTNIQKSNMDIEEKKLNLELLDERIELERVKADTVRIKANADIKAAKLKSFNTTLDVVGVIGNVVKKMI